MKIRRKCFDETSARIFLLFCFLEKVFDFLTLRNISSNNAVEVIYADFSNMSQPVKSCGVALGGVERGGAEKDTYSFQFPVPWRLIMKSLLRPFIPLCCFKKGSC